jgi:hypothetical protein
MIQEDKRRRADFTYVNFNNLPIRYLQSLDLSKLYRYKVCIIHKNKRKLLKILENFIGKQPYKNR